MEGRRMTTQHTDAERVTMLDKLDALTDWISSCCEVEADEGGSGKVQYGLDICDELGRDLAVNQARLAAAEELAKALKECAQGLRNIGKHLIKRDCFNPGENLIPCPCSLCHARAALTAWEEAGK